MGLGEASILGRPSHWVSPSGRQASFAALTAATAKASWAHDIAVTLAGLADTSVTLPEGTELFIGRITFAADGPAFTLPPDGNPPEFAASAEEYSLALLPASRQIAEQRSNYISIRVRTSMQRSRPMKRWSQGELDECRKQVAFLPDQG